MSDIGKTALKTKIDNKVYENSSQAITGTIMNEILQDVVDTLADGGNLDAGSVNTANIADGAVTDAKLENPVSVSQNTETGGEQLKIGGVKKGNLDDVLNVNVWNEQIYAYDSQTAARNAVPANKRKLGIKIIYLLSTGDSEEWVTDSFIGNSISGWNDAINWKNENVTQHLLDGNIIQQVVLDSEAPFSGKIYGNWAKNSKVILSVNSETAELSEIKWGAGYRSGYVLDVAQSNLNESVELLLTEECERIEYWAQNIITPGTATIKIENKPINLNDFVTQNDLAQEINPLKKMAFVKKVVNLVYCSVSLNRQDLSVTAQCTRTSTYGYIYHETGYSQITNDVTKVLTLTDRSLNYICFNDSLKDFVIHNNFNQIKDDEILLEAFYVYTTPVFACWTTPLVNKTNMSMGEIYTYQKPVTPPTIIPNLHRATRVWEGSIAMKYIDGRNVQIIIANGTYIWGENSYIQLTGGNLYDLYFNSTWQPRCIVAQADGTVDIKSTNDILESDILLECLMSSGTGYYVLWTTPMITKQYFGSNINYDGNCTYQNPQEIQTIKDDAKKQYPRFSSIRILRKIGCIGDSYTKGYIYPSGGSVTEDENYAWPHYMELITGNKYVNWGVSGSTAKGWMSGAAKLSQVQAQGNKCQAYIIGLQINDRNNAAWNLYYTPVGVIGDIGTDNDTYYAWYYKLVQAVIAVNGDAKIFCPTCPRYALNDAYNQAVRDIVTYCHNNNQNVYLVDLAADKYNNAQYFLNPAFIADSVNGHYTAIGYEFMADCYMEILSEIIRDNVDEFQNVHLIPYDA